MPSLYYAIGPTSGSRKKTLQFSCLIIWLPELWRSRYGVPGRLAFFAALHLVLIAWVFLCLPGSCEHQTRYNKASEDRHKTIEHTEIHNTE